MFRQFCHHQGATYCLAKITIYIISHSTNNNINSDFSEAISCSLMMTELSKHVGVF